MTNANAASVTEKTIVQATGECSVSCTPLRDCDALAVEWAELEANAEGGFFLSWSWIGTWLASCAVNADILRVHIDGQLVGLALLVRRKERHYFLTHPAVLYLNQTGDALQDQIWIEYNNVLTHRKYHELVLCAAMNFLVQERQDWDRLVLGQVSKKDADFIASISPLGRHNIWDSPSYGVDLDQLRRDKKPYLSALSRNTRYQIRRSIRHYESVGAVKLERPDCEAGAQQMLREIAPLHIERWGKSLEGSGFANPQFIAFHEALIRRHWQAGAVDLIKLSVDASPIAYFYNFIYRGHIYFYLSGLVNESSQSKLKPGLVGHSLCIQDYLDRGMSFYDFMGGDHRYKRSLATRHDHLYRMVLTRSKAFFTAETLAREVKAWLRG